MNAAPRRQSSWLSIVILTVPILLGACKTTEKVKSDGRDARQIYDMQADGERLLASALRQAQKEEKHVLLSLGANWCSDSQNTYDALHRQADLQELLQDRFVLAMVDANNRVGFQRNQMIINRYQVDLKRGIPVLLVLNAEGELLSDDPSQIPLDSDHEAPEKIVRYLNTWVQP